MRKENQERGGSQPHVFEGDDDDYYMTKVTNNPQGLMVLVNELVGGLLLDWLEVHHPAPVIIDIPKHVIDDSPDAKFQNGDRLATGLSWASQLVNPSFTQSSVPDASLRNPHDIVGTAIYDSWIDQHDSRQWRLRPRVDEPGAYDFIPVDQGYSFGAPSWDKARLDSSRSIKDPTLSVSTGVVLDRESVRPFLERIDAFNSQVAQEIVEQIPYEWLPSEDGRLALIQYMADRAKLLAKRLTEMFGNQEE